MLSRISSSTEEARRTDADRCGVHVQSETAIHDFIDDRSNLSVRHLESLSDVAKKQVDSIRQSPFFQCEIARLEKNVCSIEQMLTRREGGEEEESLNSEDAVISPDVDTVEDQPSCRRWQFPRLGHREFAPMSGVSVEPTHRWPSVSASPPVPSRRPAPFVSA